jgi:excinuclease ABC subunit A
MLRIRGLDAGRYGIENLEIPLGQLICFRGGAGSGAQALAHDVLLGESRRRFLRALSPQDRERFGGLGPPVEMEDASGLPPAQSLPGNLLRGRVVDVLHLRSDLARILHALAHTTCRHCGGECRHLDDDRAVEIVQTHEAIADRCLVIAPLELCEPPTATVYDELVRAGFPRVLIEDEVLRIDSDDAKGRRSTSDQLTIHIVIDRLIPATATPTRLGEAIRNARAMAHGRVFLKTENDEQDVRWLNRQFSCRVCGLPAQQPVWDDWLDGDETNDTNQIANSRLAGRAIAGLKTSQIGDVDAWLSDLLVDPRAIHSSISDPASLIGRGRSLLAPAIELGLGKLPLWRQWSHLAFGERLLLSIATAISQRLSGLLHVVDPPLSGLPPTTLSVVMEGLGRLVTQGGTVVFVDADSDVAARAQVEVDLHKVESEAQQPLAKAQQYEREGMLVIRPRSPAVDSTNLDPDLQLDLPLGCLICLDGPSGSGKSALMRQLTLGLAGSADRRSDFAVDATGIRRCLHLSDEVLRAGQGTLMQLLTLGRDLARLFAATSSAQEHQLRPEWFELERPGGRCARCEGEGEIVHRLEYVEDLVVICLDCEGRRFREEVFVATVRGASIGDLMEMTVDEAARFLHREQRPQAILRAAQVDGLASCRLGMPVRQLDRLLILRALLAAYAGRADHRDLFLIERAGAGEDEAGARQVHESLRRLVARGATVVATRAVAVTPDNADWLVSMGPGTGAEGGRIVVSEQVSGTA